MLFRMTKPWSAEGLRPALSLDIGVPERATSTVHLTDVACTLHNAGPWPRKGNVRYITCEVL
jgi:hypothetical protein